jgi:hypothetical protein
MRTSTPARFVEIGDGRADDGGVRIAAKSRDLPLEARRDRDVIRVEPRHVAALRRVEPRVERRRQPELLVVPQHPEPPIGAATQYVRGCVR